MAKITLIQTTRVLTVAQEIQKLLGGMAVMWPASAKPSDEEDGVLHHGTLQYPNLKDIRIRDPVQGPRM